MIEGMNLTYGESELAFAVIKQAWEDASLPTNGYESRCARNFLCGYPKIWQQSLRFWCSLSGIQKEYLMQVSRKQWKPYLLKGGKKCKSR